jgi:ABC-type uncharacterized transport system permease subunit
MNVSVFGFKNLIDSDYLIQPWEHNVPEKWYASVYLFSVLAFCAVAMLLGSNLYGVIFGETVPETHYNAKHCKEAKENNLVHLIITFKVVICLIHIYFFLGICQLI